MKIDKIYPVISWLEIIDLIQAVLYWMVMERSHFGLPPCGRSDWSKFRTISLIILEADIITERRLKALIRNKEFGRILERKIWFLFPGQRGHDKSRKEIFFVSMVDSEVTRGRGDIKSVFFQKRIRLTDLGWKEAPQAIKRVSHVMKREQFLSSLASLRAKWPESVAGRAAVAARCRERDLEDMISITPHE
jgi:hypothetical protein